MPTSSCARCRATAGVRYVGLVLNRRGFERALAAGCDEIGMVVVATDTFNQRNQGVTTAESIAAWREIARAAKDAGLRAQVTLSAAFGCPFEGEVAPERVVALAREVAEGEPVEIAIADSIGAGVPAQVTDLVGRLREALPGMRLRCHFHNTRNTGIANAWAAVEAGVETLDASIGGIGGCPFAPAATGNIPTEDLLYMLSRMRIETGVDLARTIATARWLEERFGRKVPGLLDQGRHFPGREGDDVSYRLGIDVGGTFTDLLLVDEKSGRTWSAKVPSTPKDQSVGVLQGPRPHLQARRHRAARDRPRDARHDRRDQHRADQLRRESRAGDDEGLPPGAADRALLRAGRPRRLGDLQQVAADGAARAHHRGRRARGCARRRRAQRSTRRRCATRSRS